MRIYGYVIVHYNANLAIANVMWTILAETLVELFKNFMNICHPKAKFTFEKEQNKCFNFLDVKVIRENNVFATSVYCKPSFSGVYMHFDSYMPLNYKFSFYYCFSQFYHML